MKKIINKLTLKVKNNSKLKSYYSKLKSTKLYSDIGSKFNLEKYYSELNPSYFLQKLQDKLVIATNNDDDDNVFLSQSVFWGKAITWVLIGGTTFGLGWVSIAKTDEVVIALGKLEPKGGVIDVQMPLEGIAKKILVEEGEVVKKGQLLILLDTEISEARNSSLTKQLELNTTIKDKLQFLVKQGAASQLQYLEHLSRMEELQSQIKSNLVRLKYQEIIAPENGIVFELQPKGPGYVARTSEPVLKIVPTENLLAKVDINSRTIGFVQVGKKVDISIDSFPATDFGVIEGVVSRIGSDTLPPDRSQGKGYRYPAEITLSNQYLKVKSGKKLPLQTGMSLTANIKLRKVTYLQLLLNKFGDKTKSLKAI